MPHADASIESAVEIREGCFCFRARRTARVVTKVYDDALRHLGIEGPQLTLLSAVAIAGEAGQRIGRLSPYLAMDPTTLSRNLRQLEQLGWVKVEPLSTDRRVRLYRLTPAGLTIMNEALPVWRATTRRLESRLSESTEAVRVLLDAFTEQVASAATTSATTQAPDRRSGSGG